MPRFSFQQCFEEGRRVALADVELRDNEAARDFAVGLAEKILRAQDASRLPITSHIVILDADGEELDTMISEAF